jgi:DNA-binding NtrC family response regulator
MDSSYSTCGEVLLVDDEPNAIKVLSAILKSEGYGILESANVTTALGVLSKHDVDAVITDMKMPGQDGMHLYQRMAELYPDIPVIFLTAYGTVDSAVNAINCGAYYYFVKPPDYVKMKTILARAVEQRRLKKELAGLKKQLLGDATFRIIGSAPSMLKIFDVINAVKDSASSILISGETGTGKELIARSLHYQSCRHAKPFIAVNCAAIPRTLIESELFGYEKGAFTGALAKRIGKFEEAEGGTVFLDEIGELELPLQSKLLRVLQEREIVRLGSNTKIPVNFRLVSSTNRDLKEEISAGNFREDLYYRINVVELTAPPLRERRDDIPVLAVEFLKELCASENKIVSLSHDTLELFINYDWPGNVRQLKNIVERAVVLAKGRKISPKDLPDELLKHVKGTPSANGASTLRELEAVAIRNALNVCQGNKSMVAKMLGISRKSLYKKLGELQL